jgi:hypothetical protein
MRKVSKIKPVLIAWFITFFLVLIARWGYDELLDHQRVEFNKRHSPA